MRDHLDPIKRTERAQAEHAPVQHEHPAVPEHAHLAPELVREVGRHLLERDGARRVDRAEAALDHQVREREVVPEARVDLLVALAPHGVDRAVAAGHGVHERLARPQPDLVAPVRALLVRALGRAQLQPSADVGHPRDRRAARPGAAGRRAATRSWRPRTRRRRHRRACARRVFWALTLPPRGARTSSTPRSAKPRTISSVPSLEASEATTMRRQLARVVERERVLELGRDHVVLVVGGDHERDARPEALVRARRARAEAGERGDEERIQQRASRPGRRARPRRSL